MTFEDLTFSLKSPHPPFLVLEFDHDLLFVIRFHEGTDPKRPLYHIDEVRPNFFVLSFARRIHI